MPELDAGNRLKSAYSFQGRTTANLSVMVPAKSGRSGKKSLQERE
jgi:hypothetical protein